VDRSHHSQEGNLRFGYEDRREKANFVAKGRAKRIFKWRLRAEYGKESGKALQTQATMPFSEPMSKKRSVQKS